jgi:multisubunit Na+/H+ antiporter MnhB subunit
MVVIAAIVVVIALVLMYLLVSRAKEYQSRVLNLQLAVIVGVVSCFVLQLIGLAKLAYTANRIVLHDEHAEQRNEETKQKLDQTVRSHATISS